MISSSDGTSPSRTTRATASPAASVVLNPATSVAGACGSGLSCTVACVMTPRVPSLPTKSLARSYPATPLTVRRPVLSSDPSASTTSKPSTESVVTPYFTQHRPPALVDKLPPMVHQS